MNIRKITFWLSEIIIGLGLFGQAPAQSKCPPTAPVGEAETGLVLQVFDENNATIGRAHVLVRDENGRGIVRADTNQDGELKISRLARGKYQFSISAKGFQDSQGLVDVCLHQVVAKKVVLKSSCAVDANLNCDQFPSEPVFVEVTKPNSRMTIGPYPVPHEPKTACPLAEQTNLRTDKSTIPIATISNAVFFKAGLAIDADGAPNAYGPHDKGLDLTAHARNRKGWVGVATDEHGQPLLQKRGSYRGYYVSTTALADASIENDGNPRKYVDSRKIPYIVLPAETAAKFDIRLGDLAVVANQKNGRAVYAIYADIGPAGKLGEGSIALAKALRLPSNPRTGGVETDISFLIFPGSGRGPGKLRTVKEINRSAARLYKNWGGNERLHACEAASQETYAPQPPAK